MRSRKLLPPSIFDENIVFANKTSVTDVALSIENFIMRNYSGLVSFSKTELGNRFILVEDHNLAMMIKSVIKELTLAHTCNISFSAANDDFIISFKAHPSTPPTKIAIKHLCAEAKSYGLSSIFDGISFEIIIPTHRFSSCPIYNRNRLKFYIALHTVFSEQF